jgi:hypothetical protein
MIRIRQLLTALAVIVLVAFTGCGSDSTVNPTGPISIPFELVVPGAIVKNGNYYGMSGILSENGYTRIGDTTIEVRTQAYYAQFFKNASDPMPANVTINGAAMARHKDTDTLRLSGGNTTSNIYGTNIWMLTDSAGKSASFPIGAVDPLDSVAPFELHPTVRGDTDLILSWKIPDASQGLFITWTATATNYTYSAFVADIGRHTIPKDELKKLVGTGNVRFTRFISDNSKTFQGRTVSLLRMSQRAYRVTVQP